MRPVSDQFPRSAGLPRQQSWHLHRPVPFALLDVPRPLTVLQEPAGSGKSVLLTAWASAQKAAYFVTASDLRTPDAFWSTVVGLASSGLGVAHECGDRASCAWQCVANVLDAVADPTVLVIDDYDEISTTTLDEDVVRLLQRVARLRVVVAGRRRTGLADRHVQVRVNPHLIGPGSLEAGASFVVSMFGMEGLVVDPATAEQVRLAANGTPLGIRALALAANQGHIDLSTASLADLQHEAAGVFCEAVFDRPDARGLLEHGVCLALLPAVTAEQVDALTGHEDPAGLLQSLVDIGAGRWGPTGQDAFRFEPLVRQHLASRFELLPRGRRAALSARAAQAAFDMGDARSALTLAVSAGDFDLASNVAMCSWRRLSTTDADATIRALDPLPAVVLSDFPHIAILLALTYNAIEIRQERALGLLEVALEGLIECRATSTPARRVILLTYRSGVLRVIGRVEEAREAALTAEELLAADPPPKDEALDVLRSQIDEQNAMTFHAAGHPSRALTVLRSALSRSGLVAESRRTVALLAGLSAVEGDRHRAAQYLEVVNSLPWSPMVEDPYIDVLIELAKIFEAIEQFDPVGAQGMLDRAEPTIRANEHWPLFTEAQMLIDLISSRPRAGGVRLAQRIAEMTHRPVSSVRIVHLAVQRSTLALAAGQGEMAFSALRDADPHASTTQIAVARAELARGRYDEALQHLVHTGQTETGPRLTAERGLLLAVAMLRSGKHGLAVEEAQAAVIIMNRAGTRLPILLLPAPDRRALASALRKVGDAVSADFVADLGIPDVFPIAVNTVELSAREIVVLKEFARGTDVPTVAHRLFVSPNTVKTQLKSVYRKLGASSKMEAILAATQKGFL